MSNENLPMLRASVRAVIAQSRLPSGELIRSTINQFRVIPSLAVDDDAAEQLAREIEAELDIQMTIGSVIQEEGFVEWYGAARAGIEPYYWDRYRLLCEDKKFAPAVVATLDQVTDRITGLLENPAKEGPWDRRGMVVGHVQSGKTANYTGLICKAADAGYRLIVVIAGIHNNLRNQTQQRIDEGFVGRDSGKANKPPCGVARWSAKHFPVSLTTATGDFSAASANAVGLQLGQLKDPLVLVIKKNTTTLRNLTTWLKAWNTNAARSLVDTPMLVIDDEADNASINTSGNPGETTRINGLIRNLLNLFSRKCYVGYTATPFANIFIDPDTNDEMLQADLFPRDFIVTLDAPTNYFGAARIFQEETGKNHLRDIDDNADHLPVVHKREIELTDLPPSLLEAVRTFMLARSIRMLRGQGKQHTSMLVNASRFTRVQKQLRDLIHDYVGKVVRAVRLEAGKPLEQALRSRHIAALKETFEREYADCGFSWAQVQKVLLESIAPIRVEEVNSSSSGRLDYEANNEDGLQVIAVGGFSLSRGLTLEGLTVSYFLRNSIMYDTLLQMGRWFGYRPGYVDLCRIWMPSHAQGWFEHISIAIEELREELRLMEQMSKTPRDFGLRVRNHPDAALIVTARNKMRATEKVTVSVGLNGHFIETYALDRSAIAQNRKAAIDLVSTLRQGGAPATDGGRHLWSDVGARAVLDFLEVYRNHPRSLQTASRPVIEFIEAGLDAEMARWDVAVIGRDPDRKGAELKSDPDLGVICQKRKAGEDSVGDLIFVGEKNRVSTRGIEAVGLDATLRQRVEESYRTRKNLEEPANYPDYIYRSARRRPLLLIQPLDIEGVSGPPAVAWSISFPTDVTFSHRTVSYAVNTQWWREFVGDEGDEEEVASEAA